MAINNENMKGERMAAAYGEKAARNNQSGKQQRSENSNSMAAYGVNESGGGMAKKINIEGGIGVA